METAIYGFGAAIAFFWLFVCAEAFWDYAQEFIALQNEADALRLAASHRRRATVTPPIECQVAWAGWAGQEGTTQVYAAGDLVRAMAGGNE